MAQVSRKQLAKALLPTLARTSDSAKLAKAVARYLSEERRTKDLDGLMRDITVLRAENGIIEVTATSAFTLSNSLKRDIRSLISKKHQVSTIIINEVVDPEVLGGLKIETGEHQLDATVQAKLKSLKRAIT